MRFPSLHKLHAQKYKTSLSHRFRQCNGKPGRWVIFHIPFFAVSARGATAVLAGVCRPSKFQFTPLREGRRAGLPLNTGGGSISIHAPARGATSSTLAKRLVISISIHAPARGATFGAIRVANKTTNFNSRPCERGDQPASGKEYS